MVHGRARLKQLFAYNIIALGASSGEWRIPCVPNVMQKRRGSRCSFSSFGRASWLWESEAAVPRIVRSWELAERVERGCSTINPTALPQRTAAQDGACKRVGTCWHCSPKQV